MKTGLAFEPNIKQITITETAMVYCILKYNL